MSNDAILNMLGDQFEALAAFKEKDDSPIDTDSFSAITDKWQDADGKTCRSLTVLHLGNPEKADEVQGIVVLVEKDCSEACRNELVAELVVAGYTKAMANEDIDLD